jgi:enoyl-CoA hydratase
MPIQTKSDGAVLTLSLLMPRGNAINFAFIEALGKALDDAERSGPGAMVMVGQGRAFGAGLDLVEAYEYDRGTLARFVDAFDDLFLRLFALPMPVVAAVNGHAIAGGCVMAMAADWRVMASGAYSIAINEVELGIPFPAGALEVSRHALPRAAWTPWFLEGRRFTPAEAHQAGLVHELAPDGGALEAAAACAIRLASLPSQAQRAIKADLRAPTLERARRHLAESRARFVEAWFAAPAREKIGALRASLLAKKVR